MTENSNITFNVGNLPKKTHVKNIEVENQHSDVEIVGIKPLRFHEGRMRFVLKNCSEVNTIVNCESCRSHLGLLKCRQCAIVLVGQVCDFTDVCAANFRWC